MTLIASNQEMFLRILSKGNDGITNERASMILKEMRDDMGWVNFEDLTSRKPEYLTPVLDITETEAQKFIGVACAMYPPQQPVSAMPTVPHAPQILTL